MDKADGLPASDHVLPARSAAASRRRTWIILASISIGWKVLVFTLGAAIPRWVIKDGVSELAPGHRVYGAEARRTARALYTGPIERHGLVRAVRVIEVHPVSDASAARACGGLGASVRAYTYFAIPYSEARTVCGTGQVVYRIFRKRHASDS